MTLRELVLKALTDAQLKGLAHDHFEQVYNGFSDGMDRDAMALKLVEYCERQAREKDLIQEIRVVNPKAVDDWDLTQPSPAAVDLDWPKSRRKALLEPEEISSILDAARDIRIEARTLCDQLDDDTWWNTAPVAATHARDQQHLRSHLVSLTLRVIAGSDYLLAMASARPTEASGGVALSDLGSGLAFADQHARVMFDARTFLAERLRDLWYALRETRPS